MYVSASVGDCDCDCERLREVVVSGQLLGIFRDRFRSRFNDIFWGVFVRVKKEVAWGTNCGGRKEQMGC